MTNKFKEIENIDLDYEDKSSPINFEAKENIFITPEGINLKSSWLVFFNNYMITIYKTDVVV